MTLILHGPDQKKEKQKTIRKEPHTYTQIKHIW